MWSSALRREEEEAGLFSWTMWVSNNLMERLTLTSGFGGFEQDSDQLWDVKVGSVVQRVHVGPPAPQTDIGAQRHQLTGEPQRRRWVAWTQGGPN